MRQTLFILTLFSLAACAVKPDLRPLIHKSPELVVVLDQGAIQASPAFSGPYGHPAQISPERLQGILETLRVQPRPGLLKSLITGDSPKQPLFGPKKIPLMARRLSQALSKASSSERAVFYDIEPKSRNTNSITSGFLLLKDGKLHLRIAHYQTPLPKGQALSTLGRGLSKAEQAKLTFALPAEGPYISRRSTKGIFGLKQSDAHWLIIDPVEFSAAAAQKASPPRASSGHPKATLEEKLRTLKHLWEEGLISEEEYVEKRRAVLRDF